MLIYSILGSGGRKPGTPIIGTATAGNGQASITFTPPAYLGKPSNNNIYTATSNPGGFTGTATSSPVTVTGLTNGTSYTFTVTLSTRTSTNSIIATSNPSAASNAVSPVAPGPFFPPFFPFFPFFPPYFPFFPPYFPFFPPYFPFFPPYFPSFTAAFPYTTCTSGDVAIQCCFTTGCNTGPQFCSSGGGCSSGSNLCFTGTGCV